MTAWELIQLKNTLPKEKILFYHDHCDGLRKRDTWAGGRWNCPFQWQPVLWSLRKIVKLQLVKRADPASPTCKFSSTGAYGAEQKGLINQSYGLSCKRKHMLHGSKLFLLMWNGLKIKQPCYALCSWAVSILSIFFSKEACAGTIICNSKLWLTFLGQLMGSISPCQKMRHHWVPAAVVQECLLPASFFSCRICLFAAVIWVNTGAHRNTVTLLMLGSGPPVGQAPNPHFMSA